MIKKYTGKLPPKGAKGLEVVACINDFMHYFVEVVEHVNSLPQERTEKAAKPENDSIKQIEELASRIERIGSTVTTALEQLDAKQKLSENKIKPNAPCGDKISDIKDLSARIERAESAITTALEQLDVKQKSYDSSSEIKALKERLNAIESKI